MAIWILRMTFLLIGIRKGYSADNEQKTRQIQLSDGSVLTPYGQPQGNAQGYQFGYQYGYPAGYQSGYPQFYPPYPYPDPYYPDYGFEEPASPKDSPPKSNFATMLLLFIAFSDIFSPSTTDPPMTTQPPAPVTTTEPTGTCKWGSWSSCSLPCKGTRYRQRMCQGAVQMDSEYCNTEVGFRPDGNWYRASNCYEYLWSSDEVTDKTAAEEACTNLDARLASLGLRDEAVRVDVVSTIAATRGTENMKDAYVGISNADDVAVYVWSDGHQGYPTFFGDGDPDNGATACLLLIPGNPSGLYDIGCSDTAYNYFCERAVQ